MVGESLGSFGSFGCGTPFPVGGFPCVTALATSAELGAVPPGELFVPDPSGRRPGLVEALVIPGPESGFPVTAEATDAELTAMSSYAKRGPFIERLGDTVRRGSR
jgi:hypothetical protein